MRTLLSMHKGNRKNYEVLDANLVLIELGGSFDLCLKNPI